MINTHKAPSCGNKKTCCKLHVWWNIVSIPSGLLQENTYRQGNRFLHSGSAHSIECPSIPLVFGTISITLHIIRVTFLVQGWDSLCLTVNLVKTTEENNFSFCFGCKKYHLKINFCGKSLLWNPAMPAMPGYRWQKNWTSIFSIVIHSCRQNINRI